jgi:hypothetical protein
LTGDELRGLLAKLRASEACQRHDLIDPLTLFIATGARMSELLGWYWTDFDDQNGTLAVTGKVVRAAGKGLLRIDDTKTAAGRRVLPLPTFRNDSPDCASPHSVSRRAADDLSVDRGHVARPGQLPCPLARGAGGARNAGCHEPFIPKIGTDADRRRGVFSQDWRRPPGPLADQHDSGPVHGPRPSAHGGC